MLHLLPQPRSLRMDEGVFVLSVDMCIVVSGGILLRTAAAQLQEEIASACGFRPMLTAGEAKPGDVLLSAAEGGGDGGYALGIAPEGIMVRAGSPEGVLAGVQTLRQIIRQCLWTLPALTIEDAPVYAHRGFHHDVTRGRVPTPEWLRQLADEMCLCKLNQLQLYVEHTYLFRDLTELHAAAVTPLTAEEIMELDEYCFRRGIELVPSLSSFGHLLELLRTKRFSPLCELPDAADMPSTMPGRMAHHTIDPTNPASLRLILGMIDEYMGLFRSRHFNICADETFDLGRGRNRGRPEREMYMGFVKALCAHVVKRGRIPMFWGDIVLKFPESLGELPPETICLNWGYSADVPPDSVRTLAQAGARQYVCPGVSSWNQWLPRMRNAYHNIRRMAEYGAQYGAVGLLNTDWGDYGHISDPRFSLPGMIMGACAAWNGTLPEQEALLESISRLHEGDRSGQVCAILAELADAPAYSWWHIVRHKDHLQGVLEGEWQMQPLPEERVRTARQKALRAEAALRDCALHMEAAQRPMIARWLNAAEAIRLWDAAYHAVLKGERDPETAQALERWLQRYERQWREASKESELWRIRDVTVFYAGLLR